MSSVDTHGEAAHQGHWRLHLQRPRSHTHTHIDTCNIHIHINTHKHNTHTHIHPTFSSALAPALGAASLSLPSCSPHPQGSHLKASWRQRPWQAPSVISGGAGLWQGQTQPLWCGFRSGLRLRCLYKIKPRNSEPQVLICKARAERPSGWPRGQGVGGVKPPRPHGGGGSEPAV